MSAIISQTAGHAAPSPTSPTTAGKGQRADAVGHLGGASRDKATSRDDQGGRGRLPRDRALKARASPRVGRSPKNVVTL